MEHIARRLQIREKPGAQVLDVLSHALAQQQILLILDNFEHVRSAGPIVSALLREASGLQVLVTSRAPLHISGEHIFAVQPMALPPPGQPARADQAHRYAAVRLLLERTRAVRPDFTLNPSNASTLVEICQRVDGLPLAIELAAARLGVLGPYELRTSLVRPLEALGNGPQDAPLRHRTLRAAIDWSYSLLEPVQQTVFRRLAVFPSLGALEPIESVAAVTGHPAAVSDVLAALVEHNLVQVAITEDGQSWFSLLDTVRAFALDCLAASGEEHATRGRHAAHFLALAEELGPQERVSGASGQACLARLEREHENIRAALRWLLDTAEAELATRLMLAVRTAWSMNGHYAEAHAWVAAVLALPGSERRVAARAWLLTADAFYSSRLGDYATAEARATEALRLARSLADPRLIAHALYNRSTIVAHLGGYARAQDLAHEALAICRTIGYRVGEALNRHVLAWLACQNLDLDTAQVEADRSLEVARALDSANLTAIALSDVGFTALQRGNYDLARKAFTSGLAQRGHEAWAKTVLLEGMGRVEAATGRYRQAQAWFAEGIRRCSDIGERRGIVRCLEGLAGLEASVGHLDQALQLVAAAQVARQTLGVPRSARERYLIDAWLPQAERRMGPAAAHRASVEGSGLTLDAATCRASGHSSFHGLGVLTDREQAVARLVAEGLTNEQIGQQLVISERTVERHVSNIMGKLHRTSRTQIATWVLSPGMGVDADAPQPVPG